MVRKNIPTITEPPLQEILRVYQRGFGYLNPEVDKSYIETIGLGPCIGVYVRDADRQLQALAHIDENHLGYGDQTNQFLAYLKNKQLTDENFDDVFILRSQQADKKGIVEIYSTLRMRGHRRIELIDCCSNVIFDKEGKMYWVDPETIQAEERTDAEWRVFGLEILARDGLKCENTGEIVKNQLDLVYPGLGRTFHVVEECGCYGIRIPIRGEFNPIILDKFKQEGLSLSLKECEYGKYIEIAKYGYPASEDWRAVIQVNNLVAKLVEKVYK
jgi:hypothetical protein